MDYYLNSIGVDESILLTDLSSAKQQRSVPVSNDKQLSLEKQVAEIKKVQDRQEELLRLLAFRPVRCIKSLSDFNNSYMILNSNGKVKLEDYVESVNLTLPPEVNPLTREEALLYTRQMGYAWRKSNSTFALDGYTISNTPVKRNGVASPSSPNITPSNGVMSPAPVVR